MPESYLFWRLYAGCQNTIYNSMPYRNLLWNILLALSAKPKMKLLNVGCGTGNFEQFLSEKEMDSIQIESFDYYKPLIFYAKRKLRNMKNINLQAVSSVRLLPFKTNYFDGAICINSFKSSLNRIFLINELKRILKPGGILIVIDEIEGFKANLVKIYDHFSRTRNIWGFRRQFKAMGQTFMLAIALNLKIYLDRKIKSPALPIDLLFKNNGVAFILKRDEIKNKIYLCSKETSKYNIRENSFINYSSKFNLSFPNMEPDTKALINVTLADLKRNSLLFNQLAASYQKIFGSAESWAEGAHCNLNPRHLISLEEYNERLVSGNLGCGCGGHYQPCYPKSYFQSIIAGHLKKDPLHNPFCSLYLIDNKVCGFIWGVVAPLDACIQRIKKSPNWVNKKDWDKFVLTAEYQLKARFNLKDKDKILYVDELGILPGYRKGIEPFVLLLRQAFSHAVSNEVQQLLCWTSKKTPLFKFAIYAALNEVLTSPNGITFMYCRDIVPALKILQQKPHSSLPIMVKMAKLSRHLLTP